MKTPIRPLTLDDMLDEKSSDANYQIAVLNAAKQYYERLRLSMIDGKERALADLFGAKLTALTADDPGDEERFYEALGGLHKSPKD